MNYNHKNEPKFIEDTKENPFKVLLQWILVIPMLIGFLIFAVLVVIPMNIWDWVWK